MRTRHKILLAYAAVLMLALAMPLVQTYGFQKLNVIRPAEAIPDLRVQEDDFIDVYDVVRSIPYDGGRVWTVVPKEKHRQTILRGRGNCSNLSYGLAYELARSNIDYQLISFLDRDEFVDGGGHTVIRVGYRYDGSPRVGLVDLVRGGLPRSGDSFLDVSDLRGLAIEDFSIEPLNARKFEGADEPRFYGEDLESSAIGYIRAEDIERYFDFIETVYVPLGSERLEKHVFDGLALLLGTLPTIRLPAYPELVERHRLAFVAHRSSLWILRSALVVLPAALLLELVVAASRLRRLRPLEAR